MIDPAVATAIVISFLFVFGLCLPVLNKLAPEYVSYRWCVVVVILALLIGVVVDFSELSDEARGYVVLGGLIIAGGYIVLRTLEKALANGWLHGVRVEAKKGDASLSVSSGEHEAEKPGEPEDKQTS